MTKVPSLSVFFPEYNEEANVENMVRSAQTIIPEVAENWEIIPVNDGSKDKTGEIIDRLAKEDPHVRPVHHEKNQGYGGAVISGFKASTMDLVFFTDGDLQFDLREINLLLEKLDEGDLILGYRKNRQDAWNRRLNAFLWGSLVKFLFGFKVKDVDCAFKLVKRKVLDKIELTAGGAMISTELLARSHKAGFRFVEVGVTHLPRVAGTQTGAKLSVILKAFRELFKLYAKINNQSR
ncbi:MAG TPA: glycosyltransferase family 2 protein [bacterium]|jgi:glycosyltransferase involved in cell wall biosynthesis|nr:glycosyltransferase family 2 protein [bacterium]